MDPKTVFQVEPKPIELALIAAGRGYYVPAYQRRYAWGRDNVKSLIASICEGVGALKLNDQALTFIGTFIFIHDTQNVTVEPKSKDELPSAVFLVIDGQQRLTIISMIAIAVHDAIRRIGSGTKPIDPVTAWIFEQCSELTERLEKMFVLDNFYGDQHLRYYPKIIRAFDDQWGRTTKSAKYSSPVASLLAQYIKRLHEAHAKSELQAEAFAFQPGAGETHQFFKRNFDYVVNRLNRVTKQDDPGDDDGEEGLPPLAEIAGDDHLQARFFRNGLAAQVIAELTNKTPGNKGKRLQQFARYAMLARYFMERVAVTEVKVSKEEYAFDMFEALNTTGEPLTAFETFRPKVISLEGLEKYESSPSAEFLNTVEKYLDQFGEKRVQASNRLLIPFALYRRGEKLSKHLRDQRNWLRKYYDELPTTEEKRGFVRGIADVATFLLDCWPEGFNFDETSKLGNLDLGEDRLVILLCLEALREAGHTITVALLAQFYSAARHATISNKSQAIREFVEVVKAVTAFFVLWRSSRVGTENIDAVHRSLLRQADPDTKLRPFEGVGFEGTGPAAECVRKVLRGHLADKKIEEKAAWIEKAEAVSVYSQSRELTRLLLLASSHRAVPDPTRPGFSVDGKFGTIDMLTIAAWRKGYEIEHIAPEKQNEKATWPTELYVKDALDRIGNLTLLPRSENASVKNKSWPIKRLYYQVLAAETDAAVAEALKAAAAAGLILSPPSVQVLEDAHHLPHLRSLAALPPDAPWNLAFETDRSRHLLERVWSQLAPWLGLAVK